MMLTGDPDDVVFEWLAEGLSPSPPAYLELLGPSGGERGDHVLANLGTVAGRLRERPAYWGELIRARNWRHTLVGCSTVLLTRDPRFFGDLLDRFKKGSWVAPQLAVAMGLVHPAEASGELEVVLRRQGNPADLKTAFSAYGVLKLMGHPAVVGIEPSDVVSPALRESPGTSTPAYDWHAASQVVRHHWDFWNNQAPH